MFYASALTFANRCEEALEPIDQAIKLSPRDPRTFNFLMNKAMIVGEMGDLKLSVDLARKAVAIPQGDFRPALILAIYCAKSGLLDEAQKASERVLKIIPNFTLTKLKENFFSHFETKLLDSYILNLSKLDVPK